MIWMRESALSKNNKLGGIKLTNHNDIKKVDLIGWVVMNIEEFHI